jgi:diaminohydroxyphosphoribosylaminopyrimidine deaminase/5-amino-6-(5-phosphoribosylamino)uracil reductase
MVSRSEQEPMGRALELAASADFAQSPNPMVGAVVVRDGKIVAEGFHARAGLAHAEVVALDQAGAGARGAELWVTLEPCCTTGRTGPCTERVIESGLVGIHVATLDPNPEVAGKGIERLRGAGLQVTVGERAEEARHLIEFYSTWVTTGRPFVTIKLAMSLDGKAATSSGESQWITGAQARAEGHLLRHRHDAILVGSGTAIADDPVLSARSGRERDRQPLRVVVDGRLRIRPSAKMLHEGTAPVLVATLARSDPLRRRELEAAGAELLDLPADGDHPALPSLLTELGRRGVTSLLVEGGPTLVGSLMEAGIGNRVVAFVAPIVIGGVGAPSAVGGPGAARLRDAWSLRWTGMEAVGPDIRLTAEV